MQRPRFLVAVVLLTTALVLHLNPAAPAQSFLEQLEKKLGQAINPNGAKPAETPKAEAAPPAASAPGATAPGAAGGRERGYLGMVGDDVEGNRGVRVLEVRRGAPAEKAGLRPGDLVREVNGNRIRNVDDVTAVLAKSAVNDELLITVDRDGKEMTFAARLTRAPARPAAQAPPAEGGEEVGPGVIVDRQQRASLGVTADEITEEAKREFSLPVRRGALIIAIRPGSAADQAGLPIGGAIVAIDGQRVESPRDLAAVLQAARPGQPVEVAYYHGSRLFRKAVRISPDPAAPPPVVSGEPPLRLGAGEDRPLLRGLERVIDGLVRPADGASRPPANAPGLDLNELNLLRRQLADLQDQIAELQRRLEVLEKK